MIQSAYNARMGIMAQQKRVDTIANNIANINTYGFKSSRVDFKDMLYVALQGPAGVNLQSGTGVRVAATTRSFEAGIPVQTDETLDFCLQGDGFFAVENGSGGTEYTRVGAFYTSQEADGQYLVTGQGKYVLGADGKRIKLPKNVKDITVSEDGKISADGKAVGTFKLVTFTNKEGLEAVGDTSFAETAASGAPAPAKGVKVSQGYLEQSNVDLASEMTKLIRAQRAFALSSKAISMADDMDGVANNLRA